MTLRAADDPVDELATVLSQTLAANALRLTTSRGGYVGGGQPHATIESDPGATEAIARGLLARKVAEPSRVLEAARVPAPAELSSESEEPRQPPTDGGVDKLPPDGRMPSGHRASQGGVGGSSDSVPAPADGLDALLGDNTRPDKLVVWQRGVGYLSAEEASTVIRAALGEAPR